GARSAVATGAVASMLIPVALADALLPARSRQTPEADRPVASPVRTTAGSHAARPERASDAAKLTVTGVLFQPAAFAFGATELAATCAVLSMLMSDTVRL